MIDLIENIIEVTQGGTGLEGRVYREYPATSTLTGRPFATVAHAGHNALHNDERGQEIMAMLAYTVRVYADTLEEVDTISNDLIGFYNVMGINVSAYSTAYAESMEAHYSTINLTCKADSRGGTYR